MGNNISPDIMSSVCHLTELGWTASTESYTLLLICHLFCYSWITERGLCLADIFIMLTDSS